MGKYRGANRYIGAWHYALLNFLYLIPVVGWIALIAHAADKNNENRRHFARSYFTRPVLMLAILLIAVGAAYLLIGADEFSRICEELPDAWKDFTAIFERPVG